MEGEGAMEADTAEKREAQHGAGSLWPPAA